MISDFHFLRPYWFIAIIPIALLLWRYWHRHFKSQNWQAVCDKALLPYILIDSHQQRKKWPLFALTLSSLLTITALAGPVWQQLEQPVFREQSALVIILDLSRSMDASDIKPSRLIRARYKVSDILKRRKEGQTALVVFAAEAYTVSPLTQDAGTILTLAKTLDTQLMPAQGSHPEKAVQQSINLLQQSGATAGQIILITDGVTPSISNKLSSLVKDNGHHLSVLAVGTAQGAPISMAGGGYVKDSTGSIVLPKLNTATLRKLAQQSGGRYAELSTDDRDLDYLLSPNQLLRLDSQLEDSSLLTDRWHEEGPWLLLLLIPVAALAFRRGYFVIIIVIMLPALPTPAQALEWNELWSRPDQRAAQALKQNDTSAPAAELFSDSRWQAAAHYRNGDYELANKALQNPASVDDYYNKGNALAKMGRLQDAITSYDQALQLEPDNQDSQYNRDLIQKQLDQQQSEQDKNNSDNDQKNNDDSSPKEQDQQEKQNGEEQSDDKNADNSTQNNNDSSQPTDNNQDNDAQKNMNQASQEQQDNQEENSAQTQKNAAQNANKEQTPTENLDDLKQTEAMQANEQWLRRIPDDPGGLLRRKFLYEHQRNKQRNQTNNESSPW